MHLSRSANCFSGWVICLLTTTVRALVENCDGYPNGEACVTYASDLHSGCTISTRGYCFEISFGGTRCVTFDNPPPPGTTACEEAGCRCGVGVCLQPDVSGVCETTFAACGDDVICDDPRMHGLRGQRIDWYGVDGGWYSLVRDAQADLHINVRVTAPLTDEFAGHQLITGVSVMSGEHSLAIEVKDPFTVDTSGCPMEFSPCLADGGLRAFVDGNEVNDMLRFSREVLVVDDAILLSASNLPVECHQFGGDMIWARASNDIVPGERFLDGEEYFEDWILNFHNKAAPERCTKYIAGNDLSELQTNHAILKIETSTIVVRLNARVNHQGGGELDGHGRVLPALTFWQMDIGVDGLDVDNPTLSGILGETARPVHNGNGRVIMEGPEAIRGEVENYRVAGPLGIHFALLDDEAYGRE